MSEGQNQNRVLGGLQQLCRWLIEGVSSSAFLKFAFGWFVVQGLFFAFTTRVGLPPDENYHVAFIGLFADNHFSPFVTNQADYLPLGEIVHTPFFLYHYLFGLVAMITGTGEQAVVAMRLLNLLIGVGSLYLVCRIANELKLSKLVRNLSIFMLSGTLMFVLLSAAVSYDNLFIFLSLAGILLLIKLFAKITAKNMLLFLVVLAAGSLVKVNFLALGAGLVAALIIKYFLNYKKAWTAFRVSFLGSKRLNIALCMALAALSLLIVHRYGYNLIKYHTYAPACEQVMPIDDCRQNALFARNEKVFGELRMTPNKDPFEFTYDWIAVVQNRTYGVYAHEELLPLRITSLWFQALLILACAAIVRMWTRKDLLLGVMFGVSLFYVAAVLVDNYQIFLASGRFGFVIHGRYLFAVLPVLYLLGNHYILKMLKNVYLQGAFVALSILLLILASLPTYVLRTTPIWYKSDAPKVLR